MVEQLKKSNSFTFVGLSLGKVTDKDRVQMVVIDFLKDIHGSSGNIPYDDLTAIVYNDVLLLKTRLKKEEFQEFINDCKESLTASNSLDSEEKIVYEKYLNKINRHVSLAIIQRKFIAEVSSDAEEKIIGLNGKIEDTTTKISSSEAELSRVKKDLSITEKRLNETKGSMYTEFIAILGIFSALLFGLFVGFDTFKELIASISSNAKISRSIIMGSLLLIGLDSLVFLLFEGIASLTDKNFKVCCDEQKCPHKISERYPVYFFSMLILIMVVLVSGTLLILNNSGVLYSGWQMVVTIVITLFIVAYLGCLLRKFIKK